MATGAENYLSLVRQAFQGDLKLPAFQRDFKWTRKQVIRLYDSIRQSYPIGSIILLEGSKKELKERTFRGASDPASGKLTKRLVLDGQQRITAGIDLFYGENPESISQYFIDIFSLRNLILSRSIDTENDNEVRRFLNDLDDDDGYCVGRSKVESPFSLLNSKHLLSTVLLRPENSKKRDVYLDEYQEKFPDDKHIIKNIIKPFFVIHEAPDIPYVSIDSALQLDSISRIFSTLNSSGKVLTPFELVVAVLFSSDIDLREDLDIAKETYPLLRNMDSTGEIVLQTAVMMAGKNQKKSLLPKELTAEDWENNKDRAASLLNSVGEFLTQNCGMALDRTSSLIPYDSIFAPMAKVFESVGYLDKSHATRGSINSKLTQWFIGSALTQRYQEGVHSKQDRDAKEMINWITEDDDQYKPAWLSDAVVPSLRLVTTKGAVANLLRCLSNQDSLKDPLTGDPVNFGISNTQGHHIFPTKFVEKLPGWNAKAGDKSDLFLNLMQLTSATNGRFLNDDPRIQIHDALKNTAFDALKEIYKNHGIPEDALSIIMKADKNRDDFHNFLKIRETFFEHKLANFGFSKTGGQEILDELESA